VKTVRSILTTSLLAALVTAPARGQQSSIVSSKHNLSASGPGAVRAASEQQICIFCHTPHNASPIQPAWNRHEPVSAYTVYSSNSLQAAPGQPTGSSKLCLSCHDGTIAVGSVLSRDQPIAMAGGITTLPPGKTNLGTDLSDDHPVSFRYDSSLAAQDPHLRDPGSLPPSVRLDARQELQCTTCHEPHNDRFGKFLVIDNANSQLCKTCHNQDDTTIAAHQSCTTCHTPHTAPSGPHLLVGIDATATCVTCHGGGAGASQGANIVAELNKISAHDSTMPAAPRPITRGQVAAATLDVTCSSCHEPHSMQAGALPGAPAISPKLGRVSGVNASGAEIPIAQYQYEVCFKCHNDRAAVAPAVSRQIVQNNTRLEFSPSAVSYHPVEAAGKNNFVPSLRPGLTTASLIYCTDCHSSDSSRAAGGSGPNGPHGSNNPPLLVARYETADSTAESPGAYALCYRCHERTSILADQSFTAHKLHVVDQRTSCSACHDAHGISSAQGTASKHSKLINFDTRVVTADPVTNRLEYQSLGAGAGQCFLSCHGVPHSPLAYPFVAGPGPQGPPNPAAPAPPAALRRAPAPSRTTPPPTNRRDRFRRPGQ
jgi:predicted CXXCH cytochrome family protein